MEHDASRHAIRDGGKGEKAAVAEEAPSFEEFYEATFRRLFTALCLVTGNRHEAEEIAQDAFLRVFERWDHVGTLEDPTGYVFRVSMNVFRNRSRRASLGVRRGLSLAPNATDDLAAVETKDEVVRLLRPLNPGSGRPCCSPRSWTTPPRRRAGCSASGPRRSARSRRAHAPR